VTVQASSFLLCSLIAAAASTVALGIVAVIQADVSSGETATQGQQPVAPSYIPLIMTASIFVVSWIAVTLAFFRDQMLHRVTVIQANVAAVAAAQSDIRSDFAALRAELAEYAEQRETEGFLNGRRSGTNSGTSENREVRPLRRVRPLD